MMMLFKPRKRRKQANNIQESGVALVTTLLLLMLLTALGLIMALTINSDMLINGYYGSYRSAYYAADSGLNIARQVLMNQSQAAIDLSPCTGWSSSSAAPCNTPPMASTTAATVLSYITSTYGSFTVLNTGQAAGSQKQSFEVVDTSGCTNAFTLASGYPMQQGNLNSLGQVTQYRYQFNYTLCVLGRAQGAQQVATSETGAFSFTVTAQTSSTTQTVVSFSAFGGFVNVYTPCSAPLVPGLMAGPMFTNGQWQFGNLGSQYIFTDPVGQANANFGYWFGGTCIQSPTPTYTRSGQTITPVFKGGYNLAQTPAPLPTDSYSQEWAVIDSKGTGEATSHPGNSDLAALKNITGTADTSSTSSGVFIPYACLPSGSSSCVNTMTGGGFMVEGNASVKLSTGTDSSSNPTQVYTITQGSTVTTITTNINANTTKVTSGSNTLNLAGVPENKVTGTTTPGTMLYVDGAITSLSGPGQGVAAIQDGSQITITASGNVNITGDVLYKKEPVTMDLNNTYVPANDSNQVLGIFTATGNIVLSSPYSNNNLQVDGSLAAIGQSCASNSCGFTVSGYINTFNNVGGQIQFNIFGANMSTENTYFDRRFTQRQGFAPPWFPSTKVSQSDVISAQAPAVGNGNFQRTSWRTCAGGSCTP